MTTPVVRMSRRRLLATAPATALTVAGLAALVATQPPGRTLQTTLAVVVVGLLAIGLPLLRLRSGRPDVERRAVGTAWAFAVIVWWVPGTRLAPQVPGWAWTAGVLAAVAAAYGIGHLLAGPDAPRPSATGSAPAGAVRTRSRPVSATCGPAPCCPAPPWSSRRCCSWRPSPSWRPAAARCWSSCSSPPPSSRPH
ncbi:hypothetical protein [Pseudonocardia alni]|uniref:hypothetical protein n=1 Tax=Pseudonocardia alni TaxID=33907 RepID=UPI002799EBF1|nr:hypothetical protein PaSha_24135 [Pseudonocardia alni]